MGKRHRQRERELTTLRSRGWAPMLTPTQQCRMDKIIAEINDAGFQFEYVEWCELQAPGLLGHKAGVTMHDRRKVLVRTRNMTARQVLAIAEHELEHVHGVPWATDHKHLGLVCGGSVDRLGNAAGEPRPDPVFAVDSCRATRT